jgi:A/G-specific adenine glycosylase
MKHLPTLRRQLLAWYHAHGRDLPWRRTSDPYKIWVSEILLQQTRVDQALAYYERFTTAFPTLQDLAAAHEEHVLKHWEGLGYYTRARNLHKAARVVMESYGGQIPRQADLLQLLPGVGRYTAGAVASIAFNEPAPIVDGNVKRVLARLYDIASPVGAPDTERLFWQLATELVPVKNPGDFNQAMMELGARICTPRSPLCEECPVAEHCAARAKGIQEERPVRTEKKVIPHKEIVVAVLQREGRYLLGRRPSEGLLGGLWEFPGGKVEVGETHQQALLRECREELGLEVTVGGMLACVRHAYTHFRVTLNVYRCTLLSGDPTPKHHTELRWVPREDFHTLAFPKANHKFLHLL